MEAAVGAGVEDDENMLTDAAVDLPVARAPFVGVLLSSLLFEGVYSPQRVAQLADALDYAGRIVVDLYWDAARAAWQLCPQRIPAASAAAPLARPGAPVALPGGLECSTNPIVGPAHVLAVVSSYLRNQTGTEFDVPISVVLNLHSLNVSPSAPSTAAPMRLADIVAAIGNAYTPTALAADRAAAVAAAAAAASASPSPTAAPAAAMTIHPIASAYYTGPWLANLSFPSTAALAPKRVLVAFGSNNLTPADGYSSPSDTSFIFSAQELASIPAITSDAFKAAAEAAPSVAALCSRPAANIAMVGSGADADDTTISVPAANRSATDTLVSWNFAYIQETPTQPFTFPLMALAARCGFAPLLTQNYTNDILNATVWSWAVAEPANDYSRNCASLVLPAARWITETCEKALPVACADQASQPLRWSISSTAVPFPRADSACAAPLAFALPRTAHEHAALVRAMSAAGVSAVWINYNRVTPVCWVRGWESPCPYKFSNDLLFLRLLGANLKVGIFIVLIFVLFLAYQTRNQWRASRENRRRAEVRRKIKQMEYKSIAKSE
ncbi:hypothetical protein HK105_206827 [Polyrhizophydium stewartii]|uniref:C-type lectin domain-containing protein n=1 Tax=Polyrhizophydium stewartii TaxID=2732419 RepID=A0ABR4N2E3_9FUNG